MAKEIIKENIEQNKDRYLRDFPETIVIVDYIRSKDESTHIATVKAEGQDIHSKIFPEKTYLIYDKSRTSLVGIFKCIDIITKAKRKETDLELKRIKEFNISENDLYSLLGKDYTNLKETFYKELSRNEVEKLRNYIIDKEILQQFFITFHPSYSYEEFIEGIRLVNEDGNLNYKVHEGIFKRICRMAYNSLLEYSGINKKWLENEDLPELTEEEQKIVQSKLNEAPKFYLIIDEINRGDLARVFGELITLIEADKRLFCDHGLIAILPYSRKRFGVPPNLYIIATMNTADKSIALIDVALRRRFGFIEIPPATIDSEWVEWLKNEITNPDDENKAKEIKELAVDVLKCLNDRIRKEYDKDHQIGHSYLFSLKKCKSKGETIETLKKIWYHEILPLLEEYFYDSPQKLKTILNNQFIKEDEYTTTTIFEYEYENEKFLNKLKGILSEEKYENW